MTWTHLDAGEHQAGQGSSQRASRLVADKVNTARPPQHPPLTPVSKVGRGSSVR